MLDRMEFRTARVFLTPSAVDKKQTQDGFVRAHHIHGSKPGGMTVIEYRIDRYRIVKIIAQRTQDGRWLVRRVDANIPSLLHGHNGRLPADQREYHLAMTRLRHIVGLVVEPECHSLILPGVGVGNLGYIGYVECSAQFADLNHEFLISSHFARLRNQQRPTGIYFGESSRMAKRHVVVSVYDKARQLRVGKGFPEGGDQTRAEFIVRDLERLSMEAVGTGLFAGKPGPVVATLSLDTSYAILRNGISGLIGFGRMPSVGGLSSLSRTSRAIAVGLGPDIISPARLDAALQRYHLSEKCKPKTLLGIEKELRTLAVQTACRQAPDILPSDLALLSRCEVRWPDREYMFAQQMLSIGAPMEPAEDIVAAWSRTTFLPSKPEGGDLTGSVAPAPPPFRTNTL